MHGSGGTLVTPSPALRPDAQSAPDHTVGGMKKLLVLGGGTAGSMAANKLRRHKFERMRPERGKDWNDELRAARDDAATSSPVPDPFLSDPDDNTPSLS